MKLIKIYAVWLSYGTVPYGFTDVIFDYVTGNNTDTMNRPLYITYIQINHKYSKYVHQQTMGNNMKMRGMQELRVVLPTASKRRVGAMFASSIPLKHEKYKI